MPEIRPRPNQIHELVRGHSLPLVALDIEHLTVIAEAIGEAWQYLLEHQAPTLVEGTEPEINALLETRLNALAHDHPLLRNLVRSVSRGREMVSHDGAHLEKRPDLAIHLSGRSPSFPLVVECKILDAATRRGTENYCDSGLVRFLVGEYAWPSREAFMVAYVRDSSSIAGTLTPFLSQSQKTSPPQYAIAQLPNALHIQKIDAAQTSHDRSFKYLGKQPPTESPGQILIWHLWVLSNIAKPSQTEPLISP